MELPSQAADGARWALVAVFALAAAEKAETPIHRAAAWHPVILPRPRWREHAAVAIPVRAPPAVDKMVHAARREDS